MEPTGEVREFKKGDVVPADIWAFEGLPQESITFRCRATASRGPDGRWLIEGYPSEGGTIIYVDTGGAKHGRQLTPGFTILNRKARRVGVLHP